jgi:hypothetical protein
MFSKTAFTQDPFQRSRFVDLGKLRPTLLSQD